MTDEARAEWPAQAGRQPCVRRADDEVRPVRVRVDVRRPPQGIEVRFEGIGHDRVRRPGRPVDRGGG